MALKTIMLRRSIDLKKAQLEELREKDADFLTREAELEAAIAEAGTEDEQAAVGAAVDQYDADKKAHEEAKSVLSQEIAGLENDLVEEEKSNPVNTNNIAERSKPTMTNDIDIRALPRNKRAFDALPMEMRSFILAQDETKNFLAQLRSMKGSSAA